MSHDMVLLDNVRVIYYVLNYAGYAGGEFILRPTISWALTRAWTLSLDTIPYPKIVVSYRAKWFWDIDTIRSKPKRA